MPIAIITDLFLLEHERTTCNNNFNKYKEDLKQTEEHNNNVDRNIDKNIDKNIKKKLDFLYESNNIPNIIFHGDNLTGKKTMIEYFLYKIYKSYNNINKYVLLINCGHGKGNIKFIRDNLKHFANIIINDNVNNLFKTILLLNADKLTIDAQSALRRCIEIYNHSTRFFITVDDKYKILKPILSRFSDIYCNKKIIKNKSNIIDLSQKKLYNLNKFIDLNYNILDYTNDNIIEIINLANKLYNNGFSGNLLIQFIKNKVPDDILKYKFLLHINIYKSDIRNDILIILCCLNFIYFRNNSDLKNISFI